MTYNTDIDAQLDDYSALFDLYIERGRIPEVYSDDPVSEYIGGQVSLNPELASNADLREMFRENLMDFLRIVLPAFLEIQERFRQEQEMMDAFFAADLPGRRRQWRTVRSWLAYNYTASDFNIDGYERMFGDGMKSKEQVFDAMESNWKKCMEERRRVEQLAQLYNNGRLDSPKCIGCGTEDYESKLKVRRTIFHYPQLEEILKLIGREQESDTTEQDMNITVSVPILLRHSRSRQEIDGVTNGDDLSALLPVEYALMDQPSFYVRYQRRELQQFSSKPPTESLQKTKTVRTQQPRLEKGPIILAIDTSGSMTGRPMEISKALLDRIAQIARRQKRPCFLIVFSVRAKYLDISRPSQYGQIDKFFSGGYSGGTDGEEMFKAALNALQGKTYSMADVLIISDFCFAEPGKATARRIAEEQSKGTRFYGLAFRGCYRDYLKYLDKCWKI